MPKSTRAVVQLFVPDEVTIDAVIPDQLMYTNQRNLQGQTRRTSSSQQHHPESVAPATKTLLSPLFSLACIIQPTKTPAAL